MRASLKLIGILFAVLLASGLWAEEAKDAPATEDVPTAKDAPATKDAPPAQEGPAAPAQPAAEDGVTIDVITSFLKKMNYVYKLDKSGKVPGLELLMRGNNGNYDVRIYLDDPRKVVYLCMNRFLTVPELHPRKHALLQKLMELNWELLIGKYEWDKSDGEVRLSYTFSTENGLGYDAFAACFQLLVLTADRDYPKRMQLMWGQVEAKEPAALPTTVENKPEEAGKAKETEPKPEAPPGQ